MGRVGRDDLPAGGGQHYGHLQATPVPEAGFGHVPGQMTGYTPGAMSVPPGSMPGVQLSRAPASGHYTPGVSVPDMHADHSTLTCRPVNICSPVRFRVYAPLTFNVWPHDGNVPPSVPAAAHKPPSCDSVTLPDPLVWLASAICATGIKQAPDSDDEYALHMLFVVTAERTAGTSGKRKSDQRLACPVDSGSTHSCYLRPVQCFD